MSNPDSDSGSDSMPISVPNCFKSAEEARRFSARRDGLSDSSTESDAVEVGVDVARAHQWRDRRERIETADDLLKWICTMQIARM